jgi:hypothetical protein
VLLWPQEKKEEKRRQEEQLFLQSRTRMQMQSATQNRTSAGAGRAVMMSPLFANAGSARRIGECWLFLAIPETVFILLHSFHSYFEGARSAQKADTYFVIYMAVPGVAAFARVSPLIYLTSGFAIDISGSMQSTTQTGQSRITVVKRHLAGAIRSMAGAPGAAFGIALFDTSCKLPLGDSLLPTNKSNVRHQISDRGHLLCICVC